VAMHQSHSRPLADGGAEQASGQQMNGHHVNGNGALPGEEAAGSGEVSATPARRPRRPRRPRRVEGDASEGASEEGGEAASAPQGAGNGDLAAE
jgi:hypothetical protein